MTKTSAKIGELIRFIGESEKYRKMLPKHIGDDPYVFAMYCVMLKENQDNPQHPIMYARLCGCNGFQPVPLVMPNEAMEPLPTQMTMQ